MLHGRHTVRYGRPLRILHCPWNVAGQSAQLAASERSLGAERPLSRY